MKTAKVRPIRGPSPCWSKLAWKPHPWSQLPPGCSLSLSCLPPLTHSCCPLPGPKTRKASWLRSQHCPHFSLRSLGALSHPKPCRTSLIAQQRRQS